MHHVCILFYSTLYNVSHICLLTLTKNTFGFYNKCVKWAVTCATVRGLITRVTRETSERNRALGSFVSKLSVQRHPVVQSRMRCRSKACIYTYIHIYVIYTLALSQSLTERTFVNNAKSTPLVYRIYSIISEPCKMDKEWEPVKVALTGE